MNRQPILLNPGPVNVSDAVRAALLRGDVCHREPEVAATVASVRGLLAQLFAPRGGFEAVLFTGSGTAAVEAATIAAVAPGRKLLVVDNGVYGDRMARIAQAHAIETVRVSSAWNVRLDLERIDAHLAADDAIETVALVHHETTTGLLNPVREVGALARRYGKCFVLDAVSSLGGEELDLDEWGVDLAAATANKCICGLPGISFVLVRTDKLARLAGLPSRSVYLNVASNLEAQRSGCGAFTPAVQVLWALETALTELRTEGVTARTQRYARIAARLRTGIERTGAPLYLPRELYGNTISSFDVPARTTYEDIYARCKAAGFIIYAGQGALAGRIFRIANMGQVDESDYDRFLEIMGAILA